MSINSHEPPIYKTTEIPYTTIVETHSYKRDCQELNLSEDLKTNIVLDLTENPLMGDVIQGTGGARKLRFASENKGKSGSYRVIYFYANDKVPLFLMGIYGKGTKANLSKAEKNALHKLLASFADDYTEMMKLGVENVIRRKTLN